MEIAGGKATVARLRHGGGGEESHVDYSFHKPWLAPALLYHNSRLRSHILFFLHTAGEEMRGEVMVISS
jgi:hypothetical protein